MDPEYQQFCMADPAFYDAMHSTETAGDSFAVAAWPLPDGWSLHEQDDWLVVQPAQPPRLPPQGWKIHASATADNADRVLGAVHEYCVQRGISFKFLRSPNALTARLSKYAPRGFSGKLVTIYPEDDGACHRILTELGEWLAGEPSPYILSDLRWQDGPLYVRYGAFAHRYAVDEDGTVVEAIADADGTLVPDRRDPVFRVPEWVTLPDFLRPQLAARNAVTTTADFRPRRRNSPGRLIQPTDPPLNGVHRCSSESWLPWRKAESGHGTTRTSGLGRYRPRRCATSPAATRRAAGGYPDGGIRARRARRGGPGSPPVPDIDCGLRWRTTEEHAWPSRVRGRTGRRRRSPPAAHPSGWSWARSRPARSSSPSASRRTSSSSSTTWW
jgi:hypothetical protein